MKILGFTVNVGRVKGKLVTDRIVVRKGKTLIALVGTSAAENVRRKFFIRTDLFDGQRLSVGGIRQEVR